MKSKFINDVVEFILNNSSEEQIKKQINFIIEDSYDYTGAGVFVSFKHKKGIDAYKSKKENLMLGGCQIESTELKIGAGGMLFFKNGLIDILEIYSCDECDYPVSDLKNYKLES